MNSLQRQLQLASASWTADLRSDSELLCLFVEHRDEDAFTSIVGRYSRMVWGVSLRTLRDRTDAEDAFQAAFLRLARDAKKIRNGHSIASFLHHAARCSAIDIIRTRERHRRSQRANPILEAQQSTSERDWELAEELDRILQQIPERYRTVLILCILDGCSTADVATQLGCSVATINRRLARAQDLLRERMDVNGLRSRSQAGLGMIAMMGLPPLQVVSETLEKSIHVGATGILPSTIAGKLATGVTMAPATTVASAVFGYPSILISLLICGMILGLYLFLSKNSPDHSQIPLHSSIKSAVPNHQAIHGMVMRENGSFVANATISLLSRAPFEPGIRGLRDYVVAVTNSDVNGRFNLNVSTLPNWFPDRMVTVQVSTDALEISTHTIRLLPNEPVEIKAILRQSQELKGRILDESGEPISNLRIEPIRIGVAVNETHLNDEGSPSLPGWPEPVHTDSDGYFTFSGLGNLQNVWIRVHDSRFVLQAIQVDSLPKQGNIPIWKLEKSRPVEIEVRTEPNGEILPFAKLTIINASPQSHVYFCDTERGQTVAYQTDVGEYDAYADGDGKFRFGQGIGQKVEVLIHPSDHSDGFVGVRKLIPPPTDRTPHKLAVRLPRGVWIAGHVRDENSNQPIADATIHWARSSSKKPDWSDDILVGRDAMVRTERDGSFRLCVLSENCQLRIYGSTINYQSFPLPMPAGKSLFAHAAKEFDASKPVDPILIRLQSAKELILPVSNSNEGELEGAFALVSGRVSPVRAYSSLRLPVRNNQVLIPGCFPGGYSRIYLLNPVKSLGSVVDLTHDSTSISAASLRPCGSLRLICLDKKGKPLKHQSVVLRLQINRDGTDGKASDEVDCQSVEWFDPVHYAKAPVTDVEGVVELPGLIPSAEYIVTFGKGIHRESFGPFSVQSGESKEVIIHTNRATPKSFIEPSPN